MADRTVSVALEANVTGYMASMRSAAKSTEDFTTRNRAEMETVGRGLLGIGTAAIAGLGLAAKAAIDWESAWAGVEKTVDGTAEEMATLEGELREMARSLPATHEEIAGVAEAAGQLGIAQEDVADFTKVMIDLGETTNLAAEEAATQLARFSNIMGTATGDTDRLGSVLVGLGNSAATTEAEILTLGQRLAAAGAIAGLSESDVLAFASTLTSVGVEAEAGGTALSKVFTTIRDAVLDGSDKLDVFAEVADMSAKKFSRSFQEDPAQAIASFIEGLGRINAAGESTSDVFADLELKDQRLMRALLSTAEAGSLLSDQLELGADAWRENSALTEEAEKRYQTAAAQISMAWNSIKDAAIEVGSVVAPVIGDVAGFVGDVADAFGSLPDPVQEGLAQLVGFGGALALVGGAALLLLPRIADTKRAMDALGISFGGVATKTGLAVGAFVALQAAGAGFDALFGRDLTVDLQALSIGLERWTEQSELAGEAARFLGVNAEDLVGSFEQLTSWSNFLAGPAQWLGRQIGFGEGSIRQAEEQVRLLGEALAGLVSEGKVDVAAAAFDKVAKMAAEAGLSTEEVTELMPAYSAALEKAGAEADAAGLETGAFAREVQVAEQSLEDAILALEEYAAAQEAIADPVFALRRSIEQVSEAQTAYNDAVSEYGRRSPEAESAAWDLAEAVHAAELAALDGELSFDAFQSKLDAWVDQGVLTQKQANALAKRVKALRKEAEDYRGDYGAELFADTRQANQAIDSVARKLDAWDGFTATTYLETIVSSQLPSSPSSLGGMLGLNRYAHGGRFRDGEWAVVGEEGAEIVRFDGTGEVTPARETAALLRGAASPRPLDSAVMGSPHSSTTVIQQHITLSAPNYVGSREELREAFDEMTRTGRFGVGRAA